MEYGHQAGCNIVLLHSGTRILRLTLLPDTVGHTPLKRYIMEELSN